MSPLDKIVHEEIARLTEQLRHQVADPAERIAIAQMTTDLALLPARLARGEDVSAIVASLRAEGLNRAATQLARTQKALTETWLAVLGRIVAGALAGTL